MNKLQEQAFFTSWLHFSLQVVSLISHTEFVRHNVYVLHLTCTYSFKNVVIDKINVSYNVAQLRNCHNINISTTFMIKGVFI